MFLKQTEKKENITILDNYYREVELKEIPLYLEEESGEELFLFSDILKAEQKRISEKYKVSIYKIFELLLLNADAMQRKDAIRQKFRFNKMLFYLGKEIEKEFGEDVVIFDGMAQARAGPVPIHLGDDIKELQSDQLINISLVKDGKKISGSKENWEKFKSTASIECQLTKSGTRLAKKLQKEFDPDIINIIQKVKRKLLYLDTEELKNKVHQEFPEYIKKYQENDKESFKKYLI